MKYQGSPIEDPGLPDASIFRTKNLVVLIWKAGFGILYKCTIGFLLVLIIVLSAIPGAEKAIGYAVIALFTMGGGLVLILVAMIIGAIATRNK